MTSISENLRCPVSTKDGPVCGYIEKNDQQTLYKFKGIPYAKPPLGDLRFRPPQPVTPWTRELDCTKEMPVPLGLGSPHKMILGSEDCLYLEITSPNIKPNKPLPVMFWIPSYTYLLDDIFDPTLLINENVIFVNCAFRIGPFGFLSTNDMNAPGNCGLKDIVLALRWVQRNISNFGGDPQNVTIFGTSTGGTTVHYMMLSLMATGLFHKAIIQSASALNNWSLDKNPTQRILDLASKLQIKSTCLPTIVEELRLISASDIMHAFSDMVKDSFSHQYKYFDVVFKPCIENEFEGQQAFITKSPLLILKSGNFNKVPIIIGSNNIEAQVLEFIQHDYYDYNKLNEDVTLLVPKPLTMDAKLAKGIGHQLLKFYLSGEESLNADTKTQYLQLVSDYFFLYYINTTVKLHARFAPECRIFYYIFNYAGEWVVPKDLEFFNCAGHFGELPFLFRIAAQGQPPYRGSRDSVKTRSRVIRLWTNFAKYGNPTPNEDDPFLQIKWDSVESDKKLNYLSIGSELTKGTNPYQDRMKFWDDLHNEHFILRLLCYFNEFGLYT